MGSNSHYGPSFEKISASLWLNFTSYPDMRKEWTVSKSYKTLNTFFNTKFDMKPLIPLFYTNILFGHHSEKQNFNLKCFVMEMKSREELTINHDDHLKRFTQKTHTFEQRFYGLRQSRSK